MKITLSLILILTSALSYSQLSIGVENTIRKTNILPIGNEYPLKFENIPSFTIYYIGEKCDFGIKLGVLYNDTFFEQSNYYSWGEGGSGGYQYSSSKTIYRSRVRYSYFSELTNLRCKLGKKRKLYLNFGLGFEAKMTEKESDYSTYYGSSWGTVIQTGPYEGVYSNSFDTTYYSPLNGVDCNSNVIKGNIGLGYFFNLTNHLKINTDFSFDFITNQFLFYKSTELKESFPSNGIYGTFFLSTGISYTFIKKEKK